jgi:hypothetical protein
VERDEGSGRISTSRRLSSGKVKLRWGVSAVRHGEGLGTFYRALEAVERPGCDGEWWPSVGLKSFGFGRRRNGVALIQGGKMSGVGPGVERGDVGGDPAAGGTRHGRHCGDGWNRWRRRRRLVDWRKTTTRYGPVLDRRG